MLYNALSVGKKTPKTAPPPWNFVTLLEEDRATAIGNMHKNLVNIAHVVQRYLRRQTDIQTYSLQYFATAPAREVTTVNSIKD